MSSISSNEFYQLENNAPSVVQEKILKIITSSLVEGEYSITSLNSDFVNIGVDSITFIKMIVALESEYDFEFDDEMLLITALPSAKFLIEYVETKIK